MSVLGRSDEHAGDPLVGHLRTPVDPAFLPVVEALATPAIRTAGRTAGDPGELTGCVVSLTAALIARGEADGVLVVQFETDDHDLFVRVEVTTAIGTSTELARELEERLNDVCGSFHVENEGTSLLAVLQVELVS